MRGWWLFADTILLMLMLWLNTGYSLGHPGHGAAFVLSTNSHRLVHEDGVHNYWRAGSDARCLSLPSMARKDGKKQAGGLVRVRGQASNNLPGKSPLQEGLGLWGPYLTLMAASGAALGPWLDGYHSAFGVLEYTVPKPLIVAGAQLVVTDYWVPPLFALAAVILGSAYPILDHAFDVDSKARTPSAPAILACISYFCSQYYMSGLLVSQGLEPLPFNFFLAVTTALCLAIWDRTKTGVTMAIVTGVSGPLVELLLLKGWPAVFGADARLYHYTNPDFMDAIPLWIAWVYACGAPAVGNLGRGFWQNRKKGNEA